MSVERLLPFRRRVLSGLCRRSSLPYQINCDLVDEILEIVSRLLGVRMDDMTDDDLVQILIRSAINRSRRYVQLEMSRKAREGHYAETHTGQDDSLQKIPEKLDVHQALSQLTPDDAELVWRVYGTQEWTVADAAKARDVPRRTMERLLRTLRDTVRASITDMHTAPTG